MIDSQAALETVIHHAVELKGDYLDIAPIVEALAASGDSALVSRLREALDRFLEERNFYGRDLIAGIMAGIGGTTAFPTLLRASAVDLGDDQDSLQHEIVELMHADPTGCRTTALEFVASSESRLRRTGLWALGFVIEAADVVALAAAATDPDPEVRQMAVGSIPDPTHDDEAFAVVLRALSDLDERVRSSAVSRLAGVRRPDAAAPIGDLAADRSAGVRRMVAYALGQLRNVEAVPSLLRLLHDPDRSVREETVQALGMTGGPVAVDTLLNLAADPNPAQRVLAAKATPHALGSDLRVTDQVFALSRDGEAAVRAATVSGLIGAARGSSTWTPLIAELADDADPNVRQRIAVAAKHLAAESAPGILRKYVDDSDPTVRRIAAAELARMAAGQ
ncbi:MAG: hypothetical protein QOE61_3907 [Micromonosporaceae bacterium]|nr:hypothetical protein [Micromonosporaceae bacterium]